MSDKETWMRGAALAFAAATLLATGGGCGTDDTQKTTGGLGVQCQGINECKGMGECKSATGMNACQGMNECKGMGYVTVDSEKACTDKGGTVVK